MIRITPEEMKPENFKGGDIFVFGSNEKGIHGAGAAYFAYEWMGARMGQGYGLSIRSFAIPTKDWKIQTLTLDVIEVYIKRFIAFAQIRLDYRFYVTKIGCGLAGYTPEQIAPFFADCIDLNNIYLPQDFWNILKPIKK